MDFWTVSFWVIIVSIILVLIKISYEHPNPDNEEK